MKPVYPKNDGHQTLLITTHLNYPRPALPSGGYGVGDGGKYSAGLRYAERTVSWPHCCVTVRFATNTPESLFTLSNHSSPLAEGSLNEFAGPME